MRIKSFVIALASFAAFLPYELQAGRDYTQYVDPIIGSGGHGHVFVGASVPFGAVQLGPMNIFKGWDWCSGYHYSDSIIVGFSHTHLSGTGASDLGDITFMPYTGKILTRTGTDKDLTDAASSKFSHKKEKAEAGYYCVTMDNGVKVELTATERTGMQRYVYSGNGKRRVLINLVCGVGNNPYECYIRRVSPNAIEGFRFVHSWAPRRKVFFYAEFSRPIESFSVFSDDAEADGEELEAERVKGVATFPEGTDTVVVKTGISSVSCEGARANLMAENPSGDFESVRNIARSKWNDRLSVIDIDSRSVSDLRVFYTALYHAFIAPNIYCDVDGRFRGIDDRIRRAEGKCNYSVFSLWDTYRTLHPLFTVICPDMVNDMISSMLSVYDQHGLLPIWTLQSGETYCMPGYSSVPVIADAYLKGFRGFDAERALNDMVATATSDRMRGVKDFMKYGYIPADKLGEATSVNLEYAADDRGIALMAKNMGRDDIYSTFLKRSNVFELLFDKSVMKIRPKMADGSWYAPYDPFLANHRNGVGDFTEGNGWEYTFMVPQDPDRLIELHGGRDRFICNLDSLFVVTGDLGEGAPPDVSGMIGMYAHGNEPNHHIAYLYAFAGAQWKTAERVRDIQKRFYKDSPDGYAGNEDCGQMSAWHIASALGLYQVNPSGGVWVIGSPLFERASVSLPGGRKFTVIAHGNSPRNVYVRSAKLNGKPLPYSYISYEDIMKGGTLELKMGNKPDKKFGAGKYAPVSNR